MDISSKDAELTAAVKLSSLSKQGIINRTRVNIDYWSNLYLSEYEQYYYEIVCQR